MNTRERYTPGPATAAEVKKDGDQWTLVLVRELRHAPAMVWEALTNPAQLAEWAPFDADRNLGAVGPVTLSTAECIVKHAEAPKLLEFTWGGNDVRWELEPLGHGTRLTLWSAIPKGFIAWGAAGWHICLDVLDGLLAGAPIGRIVGPEAMKFDWERLNQEYSAQFGVETRPFPKKP